MIKVEHVITPSPEQWETIIRGMRNPMNSWNKSDSEFEYITYNAELEAYDCTPIVHIGDDDMTLMEKLVSAGTDHRKFMRMIPVHMDITAPLYWWKEYDTYKVGTVANSCSTMHKIHERPLTLVDFSHDHLTSSAKYRLADTILAINDYREIYINWDNESEYVHKEFDFERKNVWWQMIQLLPSSFNQKRTVMLNYEVLWNMYHARKHHKLDEWVELCKRIKGLPYSELITG